MIKSFDKYSSLRILICGVVIFCASFVAMAQKERNNIYLFDCTGSMITNKLWEPAKQSLDETVKLDATIPGSHVTIIPFGDNPYPEYSFPSVQYGSKSKKIFSDFEDHIRNAKYTHISDVMEKGFQFMDPNKDNRIYLLTDGKPNNGDNPENVAKVISNWCSNHKNTRFFYVALTKNAIDGTIRKALEDCPDAYVVEIEGNVIPQFADISSDIYTNLEELSQPRSIEINLPGTYPLEVSSADSLFDVKVKNDQADKGRILVTLAPKPGVDIASLHQMLAGEEYEFNVSIHSKDNRYYIVNPVVSVHVADEIPSKLSINGGNKEIVSPGARWHDSFLWSKAAPQQEITWDLSPVFENSLNNSALRLKFLVDNDVKDDFEATYNEKPLKDGDIITMVPGENAFLSITFNKDAKEGKRYFELIPQSYTGLNLINDRPAEEYEGTTLRTSYSTGWNPLAKIFFWIGIGILALLLLWFICLQRIFYPRFTMSKVEFTGPDSYYASKRIRGARKAVLTSKTRKQNFFSRIFTGKIIYVKGEHFSPELEITPASGKRKVKVSHAKTGNASWDIAPSTIFGRDEKGSLKNRDTKQETTLYFN